MCRKVDRARICYDTVSNPRSLGGRSVPPVGVRQCSSEVGAGKRSQYRAVASDNATPRCNKTGLPAVPKIRYLARHYKIRNVPEFSLKRYLYRQANQICFKTYIT